MIRNWFKNLPRPTVEPYYSMTLFTFATNTFIVPQLVQHKICRNAYNSTICDNLRKKEFVSIENQVQEKAARWMALFLVSALLPALFMVLIIGPLSDIIGKKFLMVFAPAIYLIQSVIFIVLCLWRQPFSPAFFFLPMCLTGLFGDSAGTVLLSFAYIANVTKRDERTFRLAVLESFVFIATVLAALISGAVSSRFGFLGAFIVTAIVNSINLTYVLLVLPSEKSLLHLSDKDRAIKDQDYGVSNQHQQQNTVGNSSTDENVVQKNEKTSSLMRAFSLKTLFGKFKDVLCKDKQKSKIICILLLFLAAAQLINMAEVYMGVLFLKHSPFSLTRIQLGYLIAVAYMLRSTGMVVISYIAQRILRLRDTALVIFGFVSQTIYFFLLGSAVNVLMLYLIQFPGMGIAVHIPVLRAMITKLVDAEHHGTVITFAVIIDLASSLTTSFLSNMIYSATVKIFPGFAFCLLALLAFLGFVAVVIFRCIFKSFHKGDFASFREEEETALLSKDSETDKEL